VSASIESIAPVRLRNLTPANLRLYNDLHRFIVIAAGRRSRKTLIGMRKMLTDPGRGAFDLPAHAYFFTAPTRPQAKMIYWESLKRDTKLFWAKKPSETELAISLVNGSIIKISGLDDPQRIEGQTTPPVKGVMISETGNTKPDIWDYHIRPILADNNGFSIIEGTPEGRNHYFRMCQYAAGGIIPATVPMEGAYATNPEDDEWSFHTWFSSDVLPAKEIESARRQMDERSFAQEYEGDFVSYDGNLYYNFNQDLNVQELKSDLWSPLYLTCDFNTSPMVWEVAQFDGDTIKFIAEISMPINAKTPANAKQFIDRFSHWNKKLVYLTGDPANDYETHRDHSTDYTLIKKALEAAGWKVIKKILSYHPSINGRVNITCSLLEHKKMFIDKSCKYYIRDLGECEGDGKGGKDKSDPELTHASDAGDYLIWWKYAKQFYV
jgi:hypothetical protein